MNRARWFSFNEAEREDAERVAELEDAAERIDDPAVAAELLGEADELREKWDRPRRRFQSVDEIVAELQAIAHDALAVHVPDADALDALGARAAAAGSALEGIAQDLAAVRWDDAA